MSVVSGQSNGTVEVTPSGIPVYYQSQPKRLYRICDAIDGCSWGTDKLLSSAQSGEAWWVNWREVPSVSTVLDILEGPPVWWGQQIGVDGVCELVRRGALIVVNE